MLAAKVRVAVFLHKVQFEVADGVKVAEGLVVGVPGQRAVTVGVEEDNGRGEVVVVVYDVLEVGEGFATFVFGGVRGGVCVVYRVDFVFPPILVLAAPMAKRNECRHTRLDQSQPNWYPPRPAWP